MHSLKVLEKHLHLVLLLSPVSPTQNLFSLLSVWKPRWFSLTGNVLQLSEKPWENTKTLFTSNARQCQEEIRLIGERANDF